MASATASGSTTGAPGSTWWPRLSSCRPVDSTAAQPAAGTRMAPGPSRPDAAGTMPGATAAADPPLDPPGVIDGDQGLTVGPNSDGSVVQWLPHSGVFVFPKTTSPAAR